MGGEVLLCCCCWRVSISFLLPPCNLYEELLCCALLMYNNIMQLLTVYLQYVYRQVSFVLYGVRIIEESQERSSSDFWLGVPRRKIRLVEGGAKCRHLQNYLQRDFAAVVYLSKAQNPIPHLTHCIGKGGRVLNTREG